MVRRNRDPAVALARVRSGQPAFGRVLVLWALVAVGCGGAPPRPAAPPPMQPRPLLGHVPVGARWVLALRPDRLVSDPAALQLLRAAFPEERLERWLNSTAGDPRGQRTASALRRAAVAQYPDGVLLVVSRLDGEPAAGVIHDLHFADNVAGTSIAGTPVAWKGLSKALADRDDARLDRLEDHVLRDLDAVHGEAPLAVYWPAPLGLPSEGGIGLLLSHQRALAMTVSLPAEGHVAVAVDLRGDFPPGAEDGLRRLFAAVASDELGRGFGLAAAVEDLRIDPHPDGFLLSFQIDTEQLRLGLRRFLGEHLWPAPSENGGSHSM